MLKGRSQLGPLNTWVEISFAFKVSKALWHCVVQINSTSLVRKDKQRCCSFIEIKNESFVITNLLQKAMDIRLLLRDR
jgi:hypothetical protein